MRDYVLDFKELRMSDIEQVGGKNASLGEMISQLAQSDVRVPGGFATTALAYRDFLQQDNLAQRIHSELETLDVDNLDALSTTGAKIRQWIIDTPLQPKLQEAIKIHYEALVSNDNATPSFAVRSSATAEDLPDASFAGQQESFLNINGLTNIINSIQEVFASLYNDRAIAYRVHKGFTHADVALSAGVQCMVRSDLAMSGVMFTLDTESGFRDAVFITSSYGLGETIVQGAVNPDEFYVHKPMLAQGKPAIVRRNLGSKMIKMVFSDEAMAGKSTLTEEVSIEEQQRFSLCDDEIMELARYAVDIESHYQRPMDIEWGKDGIDGKIYILQARPETVKSQEKHGFIESFKLKSFSRILTCGRAIGQKIGVGTVRVVQTPAEMERVRPGDILVADMTDPNWEPVMKRAAAIVTNRGGRTCHAAIIARELGVPAIVGCGNATEVLTENDSVTVSCAEGDTGNIYQGKLEYEVTRKEVSQIPDLPLKIMMNVGNPELAFEFAQLPNDGVGLARLEFIINNVIGVHPKAILDFDQLSANNKLEIERKARGYDSPKDFFIDKLAEGVATIASAFWPKPVIVRLSDFKSNEYRKLLGGTLYEPEEENPMLGFRGASRYISSSFRECFALECLAMKQVRETMGFSNIELMVPFVRNLSEAEAVVNLLAEHGLKRGEDNLRLIMMCEIPSNALLAESFLKYFDGFSIGSNDLTQLCLGLDRDSGLVAASFDERDPAVKSLLSMAIKACKEAEKYVGICGQGPSDHPDLAKWLMEQGISSVSLNPDSVVETSLQLAKNLK